MSEPTEENPPETLPAPPQEEAEEREEPVFDLKSLLSSKKGGKMELSDVLAYTMITDVMERREDRREERQWRRERREGQQTNSASKSPEVESLKGEISELRKIVENLAGTIQSQQQNEAQKTFVEGVVRQTTDKIMPDLQAIKDKLAEYDEKLATGEQPSTSLEDIKTAFVEAIDKMGEKVGAGGKTLTDVSSDVDKVLSLIETVEKRLKRGEGGEVDYRTMTVSTLGEIGKEMISAYRDVATASREAESGQPPKQETPASAMQTIIKRQVQNYIVQRMEAGATTLNVQEAATTLGITVGQVSWAYNQLMKEGWFHVRTPQKKKGKVKQPVQEPQTGEETETEGASEESDQVFEPPPE